MMLLHGFLNGAAYPTCHWFQSDAEESERGFIDKNWCLRRSEEPMGVHSSKNGLSCQQELICFCFHANMLSVISVPVNITCS